MFVGVRDGNIPQTAADEPYAPTQHGGGELVILFLVAMKGVVAVVAYGRQVGEGEMEGGGFALDMEIDATLAGDGSDADKAEAFRKTLHAIKQRLELLVNLPDDKLAATALQATARNLPKQ